MLKCSECCPLACISNIYDLQVASRNHRFVYEAVLLLGITEDVPGLQNLLK